MAKRVWRGRGRPLKGMHSYEDGRVLENLAKIAVLHNVDASEFFNRIVEAWNHQRSKCERLNIECRERTKNSAVFLFSTERTLVAQFPISTTILEGKHQLESYAKAIFARISSARSFASSDSKIGDLKVGMKKVSLKAEVLEIPKTKIVYTRYGTTACISNALIRDETGSMKMSLWNQQINTVHKGDVIDVKNGTVAWFSGERQLRLGKSGSLSIIKCAPAP